MSPPRRGPLDVLERLLNRAHRDELLPLAALVRVNPEGLGLADLARILAAQVRRVGSHGLSNILFRKGEGQPYEEVLATQAQARGIPMDEAETVELAIARSWFQETWEKARPDERARVWQQMGLGELQEGVDGRAALELARERLGRRFDYTLTGTENFLRSPVGVIAFVALLFHPVGCLLRVFLGPILPILIWANLRPSPAYVGAVLFEIARIRQRVVHRVTIGVVGSPSTGKDAAIRALFGIETGNISPIAGSTKEVAIQRLEGSTALYVVNTPGMGDVLERVTEEAKQILDHIDVYLYLVNAEGGVQQRELADYRRCVSTGKPVLAIVNKIDVLRPRDKDKYLSDARAKLGAPEAGFLAAAFDPLPQLSPTPIGLVEVRTWILDRLVELGKSPDELPPLPAPRVEAS